MLESYAGSSGGEGVQSDWEQNDITAKDYIKNRPFFSEVVSYKVEPTVPESDFDYIEIDSKLYKISNTPLTTEEIKKIQSDELFISDGTNYIQLTEEPVEWEPELYDTDILTYVDFYFEDDEKSIDVKCLNIKKPGDFEGLHITEDMIGLYFANMTYNEETDEEESEPIYKYEFEKINKIDMKYLPIEENDFKIYNNPNFTSWKQLAETANRAMYAGEQDTLFNLGDIFDTNYGRVKIVYKNFNNSSNKAVLGFVFLDAVMQGEFDAGYEDKENDHQYYDNNYKTSQIRAFLNAEGENWYDETAEYAKIGEYQKDKPTYVNKVGFLTNLNKELKNYLIETEIPSLGFIYGPTSYKIYKIGDKVVTENKLYSCTTPCKGSDTWSDISANFEEVESLVPYYSTETYVVGNKVYHDGSIWTCTTGGVFNTDNFERDTSNDSILNDKVFLLSAAEVNAYGYSKESNGLEGTPLPYYEKFSEELTNDYKTERICFSQDMPAYYWLRSAYPDYANNAYYVTRYGYVSDDDVDYSDRNVCPAIYVNFYEK